jgi:hypothetical protein
MRRSLAARKDPLESDIHSAICDYHRLPHDFLPARSRADGLKGKGWLGIPAHAYITRGAACRPHFIKARRSSLA